MYMMGTVEKQTGDTDMELFGYDENGELFFRRGPFTFDTEAYTAFAEEKDFMVKGGIFHLSLERTYLPQNHRTRIAASVAR